jgi:predicted aldo/keto reductase-like oxidoreductase
MDYRSLGRTGMQVSPLCLGAMMFGVWGEPDHDTSIKIIRRALDAGINFIDTADVYSQGESEVIVGKALANGRRDQVILATKVHFAMDGDWGQPAADPNKRGNSRRWIIQEVENSLRRLDTDWIDLYQVHRPDPDTAVEETLSALTDLQRQGKIRTFGSSTFPAHEIVEGAVDGAGTCAGTVCYRAAAVFNSGTRYRGGRTAGGWTLRDGCVVVEPAGRRVADGSIPHRAPGTGLHACGAPAGPLRPVRSG